MNDNESTSYSYIRKCLEYQITECALWKRTFVKQENLEYDSVSNQLLISPLEVNTLRFPTNP